jgi:hypothetical protein
MRITPAHLFLIVALAIPAGLLTFVQPMFESPEGEEPWGELFFFIIFVLATISSLSLFGTLALAVAKPRSEGWRTARRAGLGILGVISALQGIAYLGSALALEGGLIFFGPVSALLLVAGMIAFLALTRDMMISRPSGGWPKVLGLVVLGIAILAVIPFVTDLGITTLLIVGALLAALASVYFFLGSQAAAAEENGSSKRPADTSE